MAADVSRVRFDPRHDYAGVLLQQGRVLLDADWNELVAVVDRRIRAGIADLDSAGPAAGIAGVAVVPRTTPDGFRVSMTGGALSIGRGRMYVDGLLAENHGGGAEELDPLLAEGRGSTDTTFTAQPYWPTPDPLPTTGSHLAYLDVWEREVTALEAPDLVDPGIGVDTTARTQTVWQVKLHALTGGAVTCGTPDADVPGWSALTAPSGARLTVDEVPVTTTDDPCELPPSGGYRGVENQTYRVEVHAGGTPGTATFKWSRDNASVASAVLEVLTAGTSIRPATLGRDSVLGFADQDWVEITDDHRELDGQPGEVRQIEVHEEDGTLSFPAALPADLVMTTAQAAARHLRVRRWDQKGQIRSGAGGNLDNLDAPGATGLITVPAGASTSVVLEHGVVVSFSSTGADFRVGDHWVFAARTADTSVEKLVKAPPRGIHHHYARLGVVAAPDTESDCRTLWPPECDCDEGGCGDCSVCVTSESHASGAMTIQAAVDRVVADGGGTVCLAPGAYPLDEAGVVVDHASSVRIRGQGLRTVLFARAEGVRVTSSAFVTVENLTVVSSGERPCVTLQATAAVTVQAVAALVLGTRDLPVPAIRLAGVALRTALRDNVLVAQAGIAGGQPEADASLLTADLSVRDNLLVCRDLGVDLSGHVGHVLGTSIVANAVLRAGLCGIRLLGAVPPGHGCRVGDNDLLVGGTGVTVSGSGFTVEDNEVTGTPAGLEVRADGVLVAPSTFGSLRGPTRISGNQLQDLGGRGVAVLTPVSSLEIGHNTVERTLHGIVMEERVRAASVAVTSNTVTDVGSREVDREDGVLGIQVVGADRATVESNTVHGVGAAREARGESIAVQVLGCTESRVAGNSVDRVGLPEDGGGDLGIAVRGRLLRTQVSGNAVRRQPVDVDEDNPSGFQGLLIGAERDPREPGVVGAKSYVIGTGTAMFAIGTHAAYAVAPRPATVTVDTNIVSGSGEVPTAVVGVFGEVVVTGNQLHSRVQSSVAALHLLAIAGTVGQNRFRGGKPSADLDVDPERLAVLGNLSSNGIAVLNGPLDPRWDPLNLQGV